LAQARRVSATGSGGDGDALSSLGHRGPEKDSSTRTRTAAAVTAIPEAELKLAS
jgi:hypothetical protein